MRKCNDEVTVLNTKVIKASQPISGTQFSQLLVVGFAVLGSLVSASTAHAELNSQLTVKVDGLRNQRGQVCLSLFARGKGFPNRGADAAQNRCVAITAMPLLITFERLQPGSYAVAVLHDTNSDQEANRNFQEFHWKDLDFREIQLSSTGPPKFNDAVVLVAGPNTNIQIQLNYLLGG